MMCVWVIEKEEDLFKSRLDRLTLAFCRNRVLERPKPLFRGLSLACLGHNARGLRGKLTKWSILVRNGKKSMFYKLNIVAKCKIHTLLLVIFGVLVSNYIVIL